MKLNNETKIGIMVFIVLVLLGIFTMKTGKFNFANTGYTVKVQFKDIDGVNLNSPVMYNGYEVGLVEDIAIVEGDNEMMMELTLWLNGDARLREGAKAYVKNLGFMGEKYVGLTSGKKGGAFIEPGSMIIGEPPASFDQLIVEGQAIAKEVRGITTNVHDRLEINKEHIDVIMANLNSTMKSMSSIVGQADERLATNEQNIDEIMTNLRLLSVNLEEMSQDLKAHPWKILHK